MVVFVMTALGMLLLIAVGMIFYQARFEGNVLSLLAGFVLSSLSFFSLGFILSGIVPTARFATILGNVLIYPMVFLSGSFFPLELFPEAIQKVAAFVPLTYVVNLLRGLWFGEPLERAPAGCGRAGWDAGSGDRHLGEDISLGMKTS